MSNATRLLAPAFLLMLTLASPAFGRDKEAQAQPSTEEAGEAPEWVEVEQAVMEVAPFVIDEMTVRLATRKHKARTKAVRLQVIQCDAELGCRMVEVAGKAAKKRGGGSRK